MRRTRYYQKKQNKIHLIVFGVLSVLVIIAIWLLSQNDSSQQVVNNDVTTQTVTIQQTNSDVTETTGTVPSTREQSVAETTQTTAETSVGVASTTVQNGLTYVGEGVVLVNKRHGVPATYAPGENPTAKQSFLTLTENMRNLGFDISMSYSGFRSYETQAQVYQNYVQAHGQAEADRFAARPGYSEHQTGLAFDVLNGAGGLLGSSQADTAATEWLAQHAHEYGFIVRYLPGKEDVTGYMSEPWHIRYVGQEATKIYQSGKTLEEYYGVPGGTSYR